MRLLQGPLAQLVEQLAFNQLVAGSNPARPTIYAACRASLYRRCHTKVHFSFLVIVLTPENVTNDTTVYIASRSP